MTNELTPKDEVTDFLIYTTPEGNVKVEAFLHNENIWLTQKRMAELFGVDVRTVSEHLQNIFKSGELEEKSVIRNFRTTASDNKNYEVKFYNLDAILSVGYRVNSRQATLFRIWASKVLKEYIIKGFAMDDERLKNPNTVFGKDYFEEQLARIRDIRSSERRFYQKITDIYSQCSADYNVNDQVTKDFFATVQNKLHWAITGETATEIIYTEADATKIYMGLKTWKSAPDGRIIKSDTNIAKNYLSEKSIKKLERTISGYFDYVENIIERRSVY